MRKQIMTGQRLGALGRVSVCTAYCVALLAISHGARAASPVWDHVSVSGHGINLTLFMRHRAYPKDALVRVWTRMQNTSGHTVRVYQPGPMAAGQYVPQVVVLAKRGGTPLPISLMDYMPFSGPVDSARQLYPHAVHNIPELAILRGPLLRLDLTFAVGGTRPGPPGMGPTLSTPLLRLHLTRADPPAVTLQAPPSQASAEIAPPEPVHGKPLAVWYYNCKDAYDAAVQENIDWITISPRIVPTCPAGSSLIGWNEIAGWLNHSVAQIAWGQPFRL